MNNNVTATLSATQVANEFLKIAQNNNAPINSLTVLIKLVYLAHGFHLALKNRPLFPEKVEAWKYGPVVSEVYDAFKDDYKGPNIPIQPLSTISDVGMDDFVKHLLHVIYDSYGEYNAREITMATHEPGSPWDKSTDKYGLYAPIPNDLIKQHYGQFVAA